MGAQARGDYRLTPGPQVSNKAHGEARRGNRNGGRTPGRGGSPDRWRTAREKEGMRLEDIAAQTRIPQRHLEALERSEWDQLPAPTYTTGFAKSYAGAVGLDRMEIGDQLRAEMGGQRFTANTIEAFEPADPRRTMPKSLVIGTIVGLIILIALMSWLNQRSLQTPDESASVAPAPQAAAPATTPAPQPAVVQAAGPVVLTATAPVWLQV